jgi:hypothetical protein
VRSCPAIAANCCGVVTVRAPTGTVYPSAVSTGAASSWRVAPIRLLARPVASASGVWAMDQRFVRRKTTSWSETESRLPPAPGPAVGAFPGQEDRRVLGTPGSVADSEIVEGGGFESGEAGVPQPGGELVPGGKAPQPGAGRGWFGSERFGAQRVVPRAVPLVRRMGRIALSRSENY